MPRKNIQVRLLIDKDNNVYINLNNRAAFNDKRKNLKCSFNAVVDNVLYCWNDITIHNVNDR